MLGYAFSQIKRLNSLIIHLEDKAFSLEREIKCVAQVEESRHMKTTGKIFKLFADMDRLRNQNIGMRERAKKE